MSTQPVEANVVLTSNNAQYDQAMNQSSTVTQNLGQNVDSLGSKISKLTKTAGKSLIGISAADIGLITASTAAWSSYEKQMTRLQAQSAVLTRTTTEQSKLMKDYTTSVKGLRTEYGMTTSAAASLVQTLSKVTNNKSTRDLKDLSKVFEDMSLATGESADGLSGSLIQLQKLMGTPVTAKTTRQYADQFTYLAAQTNTSAQGLVDFTATLAPVGKQIGMTHNQIAGFATAFVKAGADSGPAAQVFTKITSDIAHSMQTGSPEIAHYANMLNVTQKQFKQMGGYEQVTQIMEHLHDNTKNAATELARLGLDGPRSMRAIQSIIQAGGFREAMAETTQGKGAAKRGADSAMDTLSAQIVSVAAAVHVGDDGHIAGARIAVGACSAVPQRLIQLEHDLAGAPAADAIRIVVAGHMAALHPIDDVRGSADYRRRAALVVTRRALIQCLAIESEAAA